MQEEYLLEKMIKGKTDKEKEIELMQTIIETKEMLKVARSNFEYAEDDLIDYYTYQIKAHQSKLDYLIKVAKRKGIVLSRVSELKVRMFKNNMAVWKKRDGPIFLSSEKLRTVPLFSVIFVQLIT